MCCCVLHQNFPIQVRSNLTEPWNSTWMDKICIFHFPLIVALPVAKTINTSPIFFQIVYMITDMMPVHLFGVYVWKIFTWAKIDYNYNIRNNAILIKVMKMMMITIIDDGGVYRDVHLPNYPLPRYRSYYMKWPRPAQEWEDIKECFEVGTLLSFCPHLFFR